MGEDKCTSCNCDLRQFANLTGMSQMKISECVQKGEQWKGNGKMHTALLLAFNFSLPPLDQILVTSLTLP